MRRYAMTAILLAGLFIAGCSGPLVVQTQPSALASGAALPTISPTAVPTLPPATPAPTAAPMSTPTPAETPVPVVIPATNAYTSQGLGLSFTVPKSWIGKYRVEDGGDSLTVYFNPAKPYDPERKDGELFTVIRETETDKLSYGGDWEFELNGASYAWGSVNGLGGVDYYDFEPEYDTYMAMHRDVPAVFASVKSLSGEAPKNVKRLWIEAVPKKTLYKTTMGLGIQFALPKSWLGKCRIEEDANGVYFFFNPKRRDPAYGDGLFLMIVKKTGAEGEEEGWDEVKEFAVGGVNYFSGKPIEATYGGPEQNTFDAMLIGARAVVESVRAVR